MISNVHTLWAYRSHPYTENLWLLIYSHLISKTEKGDLVYWSLIQEPCTNLYTHAIIAVFKRCCFKVLLTYSMKCVCVGYIIVLEKLSEQLELQIISNINWRLGGPRIQTPYWHDLKMLPQMMMNDTKFHYRRSLLGSDSNWIWKIATSVSLKLSCLKEIS